MAKKRVEGSGPFGMILLRDIWPNKDDTTKIYLCEEKKSSMTWPLDGEYADTEEGRSVFQKHALTPVKTSIRSGSRVFYIYLDMDLAESIPIKDVDHGEQLELQFSF